MVTKTYRHTKFNNAEDFKEFLKQISFLGNISICDLCDGECFDGDGTKKHMTECCAFYRATGVNGSYCALENAIEGYY